MSVYLKQFENHTEYENYINGSGAILPNVSICTTEGDVHYNPYVDPYNGHEYVEIGGLKWATMNIGANSVTDYGFYFQWGDTQGYTAGQIGSGTGQKYFSWANYKYWTSDTGSGSSGFTKYNKTDSIDNSVLDLEDDAARVNWGGEWRMPTVAELIAFRKAVTSAFTSDYQGSGVNGILYTDKTDSSKKLFFPAAGYASKGSRHEVGTHGRVWSSSVNSFENYKYGRSLYFTDNTEYMDSGSGRSLGFSIRGVVG